MVSNEAPNRILHDLKFESNLINLTMTYRLDSDILFPYGETVEIETENVVAPSVNTRWKEPDNDFYDEKILKNIQNKTKLATWIVSNFDCVPSKRGDLVHKLQENGIDVSMYGRHGNKSCIKPCSDELNQAKFYLALENSLCIDYVTEKVYKVRDYNVVPVVFSGANLTRFLPPRSYIDVNEFKTVKDLANHLKYLSDNPRELIKYFWWKKYYKIKRQFMVKGDQLCKICQKLNEPNLWERNQFYPSIKDWYGKGVCKNATIKF